MTAPATMGVAFGDLQSKIAGLFFGQWGLSAPFSSGAPPSPLSTQIVLQINDCIRDGLNTVYQAWRWSFMRPTVSITTNAPYNIGTVVVVNGVVTLTGGTFPSWLATTSTIVILGVSYAVGSLGPLTLVNTGYSTPGTAGVPYNLVPTNIYALPSGVTIAPSTVAASFDSIEGPFTFAAGQNCGYGRVTLAREVDLRRMMERDITPGIPRYAATVTSPFDPSVAPGSLRNVMFFPYPDQAYVLSAIMTLRPTMLDATNCYPLGAEVLAPVLLESVLAAAERNLEDIEGAHCKQFMMMLQEAVQRDKEYSTPDNLGSSIDHANDHYWDHFYRQTGGINIIPNNVYIN